MLNVKNAVLSNDNKDTIERRNERLHAFFKKVFIDRFVIIGDPNKPSVIHFPEKGPSRAISCFVHNFTLVLTSEPYNGEHLYSITLTNEKISNVNRKEILEIIEKAQHRTVFRIKVKNTNLYLSGYNFRDKIDYFTKFPVFAAYGSKVYFNIDHATEVLEKFSDHDLEITAY
jgi:hypothetical protein